MLGLKLCWLLNFYWIRLDADLLFLNLNKKIPRENHEKTQHGTGLIKNFLSSKPVRLFSQIPLAKKQHEVACPQIYRFLLNIVTCHSNFPANLSSNSKVSAAMLRKIEMVAKADKREIFCDTMAPNGTWLCCLLKKMSLRGLPALGRSWKFISFISFFSKLDKKPPL